ncbi:MAG: pyridoxal phosphate-dependent aminotransferase [Bacteroidia bacterium]|nr:pyridoxal phosphate-dependent aminotransferase [Bacteroidia bacterium]
MILDKVFQGANRMFVLEESQTLAMAKRVRELKAAGKDIISLTLGEPDFDTPEYIKEAAIRAIQNGKTKYPPVAGIPELRQAVAEKFRKQNQLPFTAENVIISTGAKQSLVNVILSLVNPGDEVLIAAPYWVSYSEMVKLAEGVSVIVKTDVDSDYKISPEQLEAAITPKTRLFIFSSPSNPTGAMYTHSELESLVTVLERHPHVFIVADEIYEHIRYESEHVSIGSFPSVAERTITVNGVSKAYAMTGWRIGFLGAPKWIADLCEKFQGQITSGANSIAQWAALAAITESHHEVDTMVKAFQNRRDIIYELFRKEIPELILPKPQGAFYFYPNVSAFLGKQTPNGKRITNTNELSDYILEEGLVSVVSGEAFGTHRHIRLSYATSLDLLEQSVYRIKDCLQKLE